MSTIELVPIQKVHKRMKRNWAKIDYYEPLTNKYSNYIPDEIMEFAELSSELAEDLLDEIREMPEDPKVEILRQNGSFNILYNPDDHKVYVGQGKDYFISLVDYDDAETRMRNIVGTIV